VLAARNRAKLRDERVLAAGDATHASKHNTVVP
jgi:hypothetical protein